jgi:hypothetical protein
MIELFDNSVLEVLLSFLPLVIGISAGGGKQVSDPVFRQFPGAFGASPESGRLAGSLEDILSGGTRFEPRSMSETNLINSLADLAGGRSAVRGLGAPTAGSVAGAIAPTLVGLRQGERGQNIQGLLELIGLAMPQVVGGQRTRGRQFQFGLGGEGSGEALKLLGLG